MIAFPCKVKKDAIVKFVQNHHFILSLGKVVRGLG